MALTATSSGAGVDASDVDRALLRLDPVFREELGRATELTLREIARQAAEKVPVRSGNLKKFIAWRFYQTRLSGTVGIRKGVAVLPARFSGVGPGGRVVEPSRYARFVHFGSIHNRAVPFMLDAARAEEPHYLDRANRAYAAAVRRLAAEAPKIGNEFTGGGLL
jgi:hypothetical protein